jgi:hypothetical protein
MAQPPIQWQRCLGGIYSDQGYSIVQTTDGGYAIVGFAISSDGDCTDNHTQKARAADVFVARLDNTGKTIWEECLGGTSSDEGFSIVQTTDEGFIIAGYTSSTDGDASGLHGLKGQDQDAWVVKIDGNGKIEWQHCYGGTDIDYANSIIQTTDGGYLFAGYTRSTDGDVTGFHGGNSDAWVVKLNGTGTIEWQKCFGGSDADFANSIIQTMDSDYVIVGGASSNDGDVSGNHSPSQLTYDVWVLKLDQAGNIIWQHCYGGSQTDEAKKIIQTSDGGYAIAAFTDSHDDDVTGFHGTTNWDAWILRLDQGGNLIWEKCYGGSGNEEGMSLVQTSDGGFVFTGCADSPDGDLSGIPLHGDDDAWLVKINPAGVIEWQELLGGSHMDFANQLIRTLDGGYAFIGWTASNDGDVSGNHTDSIFDDIWVVKLGCSPSSASVYLKNSQINYHPGDSVDIPIYFNSESGVFTLSGIISGTINFSMNTDIITPVRFISSITGLTAAAFSQTQGQASITLQDSFGLSISNEMLIGTLRCATYLTDTAQTSVLLTGGSFASTQSTGCETLSVTNDSVIVSLDYQCGDSILSRFMRHDTLFRILNIVPNPASKDVTIYFINNGSTISYELFDALGITKSKGSIEGNSLVLDVSNLSLGQYYIRASNSAGLHTAESIEIMR